MVKEEKEGESLEVLQQCKTTSLVTNNSEQGSTLRDLLTTTAGKLKLGSTDAGIAFAPVYSTASQVPEQVSPLLLNHLKYQQSNAKKDFFSPCFFLKTGKSGRMPNILDDIIASVVENKIPASRQNITAKLSIKQEPLTTGSSINNIVNNTSTPAVMEETKPDRKKPVPVPASVPDESTNQHPDIPHCWLYNRRLLWLKDHRSQNNWKLFRDCWKQGQVTASLTAIMLSLTRVNRKRLQVIRVFLMNVSVVQPVLVSGIHKRLNASLWKAESFNQEFADHQGDLLNCKDQVVTNSGIKEFWDGFEDINSKSFTKTDLPSQPTTE